MSTLYVDTITEKTSGHRVLIAGHVVQVVQFTYDIQETSTSSTFANTSFVGTITPSSSTSKVLALCQVAFMNYATTGQTGRGKGRL